MSDTWRDGRVFNRHVTFRFGDCGPDGKASVYSIMKLFSEMAGEDYEERGLGHSRLMEAGQAFLVAKNSIKINHMPRYGMELTASTWEQRIKGVFFLRDYELKGEDGQIFISGTSSWFLVSPETREILRPEALIGPLPTPAEHLADCPPCPKLRFPAGETTALGAHPVYYSDLDANGHVNNAAYSRIAQDFLPAEYREKELKEYYIVFKKETRPDETLTLTGMADGDAYIIEGSSGEEQHFMSRFVF